MRLLRTLIPVLFLTWIAIPVSAQVIEGVILSIEDGKVFTDLKSGQVKTGDLLKVLKAGGFMVHPVTGEKIQRKDEVVANITLTQVHDTYSAGEVYPKTAIDLIKAGMKVFTLEAAEAGQSMIKKTVIIPPFLIVGGKVGELGTYMADLMTEELFKLDRFRIMDRQSYDIQQFEKGLTENNQKILIPGNEGVDYLVMGSAYPPDVVEKATGIPLKGVASLAGGGIAGAAAKGIIPDLKLKELEAVVKFTMKLIDVRTGEVLFICSEMAKAEGKTQVSLESSVLGGAVLNGGATDFRNTLTGQASQEALQGSAKYLAEYFEGKITEKNFQGKVIELKRRKGQSPPPIGLLNIRDGAGGSEAVLNAGSDMGIRTNCYYLITVPRVEVSSITGKKKENGVLKAGIVRPRNVEFDAAAGPVRLLPGFAEKQQEVIKSGKLMAYKPLRTTLAFNVMGNVTDGFGDIEAGVEYYPNLGSMALINHQLWVGVRGLYGINTYTMPDSSWNLRTHTSLELLLGLNPFRKSFENMAFDPYIGLKYRFYKSDYSNGGPGVFMGLSMYGFFSELTLLYGRHPDTGPTYIPGQPYDHEVYGFTGIGFDIGWRFIVRRLAF